MKKITLLLICLLVLVGCSDASAMVSNPNTAVVTIDGGKVTRKDMFIAMKDQDQDFKVAINFLVSYIANSQVETTDEITDNATKSLEEYQEQYADDFEGFLQAVGFATEEELLAELITYEKMNHLISQYIDENWDAIIENYFPRKVRIIETTDTNVASTALERIKAGEEFITVATELSDKSKDYFNGEEHIVTKLDALDESIVTFLRENNTPILSNILNVGAEKFYIVQIIAGNPEQFREEAKEAIMKSSSIETEMIAYYCKKLNFKVYDVTLYNFLKTNYPTYLNQ